MNDTEYVRQQDRQFFIGFARSWRVEYRDDALRAQAASDHAPENYRVSTVRNVDAWYDAFGVKEGDKISVGAVILALTAEGEAAAPEAKALAPEKNAPALVDAGMMGDRADVIFADPSEISPFIAPKC